MPSKLGKFEIHREIATINIANDYTSNEDSEDLKLIMERFIFLLGKYNDNAKSTLVDLEPTRIHFKINEYNFNLHLKTSEESYKLDITQNLNKTIKITIQAATLLGARHALETLSQIILFDKFEKSYVIPKYLLLEDFPVYPIRGLMIDTARNYLAVSTIKRIIEGMAVNKLNTLHWHITDSQSFPYESKYLPELSALGAYSPSEVYTRENIQEIMVWARIRGVRIIPEFDGPAHVGEGWQETNLLACFNKQPWYDYCKEPPCGQFDPTKDELYAKLELLFRDMVEVFNPDLFHFGGDEVNFRCWESEPSITEWMQSRNWSSNDHIKLWNHYRNKTYNRFMAERGRQIPAILWTSTLTKPENLHYVQKDKYIIQVWTAAQNNSDKTIKHLLEHDYRIILSNYDALYLDCGFDSWTGKGNNWCSPFRGWKEVYHNSPYQIAEEHGVEHKRHLILGTIAALWTETADDSLAEIRIWPRTSALAERSWAEPSGLLETWFEAKERLSLHRNRMIKLGIRSSPLAPKWCLLNQDCQSEPESQSDNGGSTFLNDKFRVLFVFCIILSVHVYQYQLHA